MSDLDQLRQQLRQRGYLTLGIERWFALDPWSSRTFWAELLVVTSKAAVLIAPFVAAVAVAIMLVRNHPLSPVDTALLLVLYAGAGWVFAFVIVLAIALLLKLRPAIAIDSPAALLAISLGAALLLSLPLLLWWNGFEGERTTAELLGGGGLLAILLICSAIVIAAALLSFSIHEVQRIPSAVRRPWAGPMALAASALLVGLFVPAWAGPQHEPSSPQQIAVSSDYRPLVMIAVDGLRGDDEIAGTRSKLLPHRASLSRLSSDSPPEKWATVGTGVKTALHRVRAIEGIELAGGRRLIQAVSRRDVVLREFAFSLGLATRRPLPPTIRRRDFIWESFAARGRVAAAINWWTAENRSTPTLTSIGQEHVFRIASSHADRRRRAVAVDEVAVQELRQQLARRPSFVTVYLPALDILLNRLPSADAARKDAVAAAQNNLAGAVVSAREAGYEVIVVGLPGERQGGEGTLQTSFPLRAAAASPFDLAPTICSLLGFPASSEMPGRSLAGTELPRIESYGGRAAGSVRQPRVDEEYYENLKSLGYIR